MHSWNANEDARLHFWLRVREFAVPPPMIESATARRAVGDWAGACAAARIDVDVNLRAVAGAHGRELAARIRADVRGLAPDLLRWHMPRTAPDGRLRAGLTISLTRYPAQDGAGAVHLVARTPPTWADAGQRISLALWEERRPAEGAGLHPHPRPDRRFRLDLHRHLWDAAKAGELGERSGAARWPVGRSPAVDPAELDPAGLVPPDSGCAVDRWTAEAALLFHAEQRVGGPVTVRLSARRRLVLDLSVSGSPRLVAAPAKGRDPAWPVLPDAATWVPPDLRLLRAGLIDGWRLHPLVASALVPGHAQTRVPEHHDDPQSWLVDCRGAQHRIGLADGVLVPLDHDPAEIRREELLVALGGTPLPCLQTIDEAHRYPECLVDVHARLVHGDAVGAVAAVERLLGPDALLRSGALRDELETAARRRIQHGLFRSGLIGVKPVSPVRNGRRPDGRTRPRHATSTR